MEGPVVAAEAQVESEDYYLDLGADTNVEDFDFRLDGDYGDEAEPRDDAPKDTVDATNNFEIGYEEEEAQPVATESAHDDGSTTEHVGEDVGMEYQDEIGYDEDESDIQGSGGNLETTVLDTADVEDPVGFVEDQETEEQSEEHESHLGAITHDYSVFENDSGRDRSQADLDDENEATDSHGKETQVANGSNDASAQHSPETREKSPASGPDGSQDTAAENSPFAHIPDLIEVFYNNGQYYLVGNQDDDPDSYFLSDEKDFDKPLSDFLASIRSVISDEVSPEDELMIRINALGLEFGERSNPKFLARSFRDILSCFAALASDPSVDVSQGSDSLQVELLVRKDSEARFLELLDEIGMSGQQSNFAEDSEDPESGSASDAVYEEGDEEYEQEEEYAEEYHLDGEGGVLGSGNQGVGKEAEYADQNAAEYEAIIAQGEDDAIEELFSTQGHRDNTGPAALTQFESANNKHFEGEDSNVDYDQDQDGEEWVESEVNEQAGIQDGSAVNGADVPTIQESAVNGNPPNFLKPDPATTLPTPHKPTDSDKNEIDKLDLGDMTGISGAYGSEVDWTESDDEDGGAVSSAQPRRKRKPESRLEEEMSPSKKSKIEDENDEDDEWLLDWDAGLNPTSSSAPALHTQANLENSRTNLPSSHVEDCDLLGDDAVSTNSNSETGKDPGDVGTDGLEEGYPVGDKHGNNEHDDVVDDSDDYDTSLSESESSTVSPAAGAVPAQGVVTDYDLSNGNEPTGDSIGVAVAIHEGNTNDDAEYLIDDINQTEADSAEIHDSKSKHTSRTSTINGDDVSHAQDFEHDFLSADAGQPQQEKNETDEIDWENEGDEPEQTTAAHPSATAFGKRGRVNDTESLADEADHKRRRT
ncbi:hypothetical protein OQA88_7551 [Cercophora sp. LCS_1]